jgi:hypothetical protein
VGSRDELSYKLAGAIVASALPPADRGIPYSGRSWITVCGSAVVTKAEDGRALPKHAANTRLNPLLAACQTHAARPCGLALVHDLVEIRQANPRTHPYFQTEPSYCVLMLSSHVIGFLLLVVPRALTGLAALAATLYFQTEPSHCVLMLSSHVIGFLLFLDRPSWLPQLFAVLFPRHDVPPRLPDACSHDHARGLVILPLAALIPGHQIPPCRASTACLAETRNDVSATRIGDLQTHTMRH